MAEAFFDEVLAEAKALDLLPAEHFTVDGTLIEAWAGLKSFQRKDGSGPGPSDTDRSNPTIDFHGETRRNDTTHPPRLRMRGWRARAMANSPSYVTAGACRWRIATGW